MEGDFHLEKVVPSEFFFFKCPFDKSLPVVRFTLVGQDKGKFGCHKKVKVELLYGRDVSTKKVLTKE